jgi:hypothetical protein
VRIEVIVREVSKDDESMYGLGPDNERIFRGRPLREFLARIDANGYVEMPLPAGPLAATGRPATTTNPGFSLIGSRVDPEVEVKVRDEGTVLVSLRKWRDRDPDNTYLQLAFQFNPTDEEEQEAVLRATQEDLMRPR